jgi:hypothetical protein
MPEPRRRRQRTTALLQPADIPGLTHLQRAVVVTRIGESLGCLFPSRSTKCPSFKSRRERHLAREGRREVVESKWGGEYCFIVFLGLGMVPDVSYNYKLQLQPHQGALRCLLSTRLLLFLNRKTENRPPRPPRPTHATPIHPENPEPKIRSP